MKSAMHIYRSNRVESLLDLLIEVIQQPLASPLAPECIIVQSKGMATWLSMQLSSRFGIWANPDFPHPRQFIQRLLRATLGEEGDLVQRYNRERLAFVICALLDDCRDDPDFSPLISYLGEGPFIKKLQLARQIAQLFDQYAVYRPEMVLAWEAGEDQAFSHALAEDIWQPKLWRRLTAHLGCCSPARLMLRCRQSLAAGDLPFPGFLPARVSLFGSNTLPTVYLGIMGELARIMPVHFFLFSPAEGYFADIRSRAESHRALAGHSSALDQEDLYLETGHPLLASMGAMARDFQEALEDGISYLDAGECYHLQAGPATMLEILQDDIFNLRHRCPANDSEQPQSVAADDSSIRIHACHSRLREVEVLQDQLLALLNDDPDLNPREIVVMLPEVSAYAPLIEAVFGVFPEDKRFIPYRIADRPLLGAAPLIDVFFRLLRMAPGRMAASEVVELLACEEICLRFGFTADDLPRIRLWLEKTGIRWGIDELHREALKQPRERQNTWRFGFDRLTLGYAFQEEGIILGDILPYGGIEGQGAELAGRFMYFCETLFAMAAKLSLAREMPEWQRVLTELLQLFFTEDSSQAWQVQNIRDSLAMMVIEAQDAGFTQPLDLNGIVLLLEEKLSDRASTRGFLEGGLTFCGMLPMRSLPFKVICLLGMNDGDFPRVEYPQSFNLIARYPQRGDRSRRNDDRYLFLEALLAAREKFLLFYQGNNQRDGKALPPAVVVEELLDCLADSFSLESDSSCPDKAELSSSPAPTKLMPFGYNRDCLSGWLVTRHPLQPFSRRYFSGAEKGLCSFSAEYCRAVQAKEDGLRVLPLFLPEPLPSADSDLIVVSLADLARYLAHPVRWFLEKRLALFLKEKNRELADREPIHLDILEKYQLARDLLALKGEGFSDSSPILARWRGEGLLPLGQGGQAAFSEIRETVRPIIEQLLVYDSCIGVALPPLARKLTLSPNITLRGELVDRHSGGQLRWSNSQLNGRILLPVWLEHLFLCAVAPADQRCETIVIGRGRDKETARIMRMSQAPEPAGLLLELATLFAKGLNMPLPFFPKSGLVFAEALASDKGSEQERLTAAFAKAEEEYLGDDYTPGEGDDSYCRQLFGEALPVAPGFVPPHGDDSPDFAALAALIFMPMLKHTEEL